MDGLRLDDPSVSRHKPARTVGDRLAWALARFLDLIADRVFAERYGHRAVVLETIAAVPGMIAAMLQHLACLRSLTGDHGWIRAMLDEAENERMHLMTLLEVAQPVWWERWFILVAQALFFGGYLILYALAPGLAHRMVGYLEEKAIMSYSEYLAQMDATGTGTGPAPAVAMRYWHLPATATVRDVVSHIRNDECRHRDVNHELANQIANGRKAQPLGSQ